MTTPMQLDYARPATVMGDGPLPRWYWALIATMVMVGLCGRLVGPMPGRRHDPARVGAAPADMGGLCLALDAFKADVGRYPTESEGLDSLQENPHTATGWNGPYYRRRPLIDPWGQPYNYVPPAGSSPPQVFSGGPDFTPGTVDDISSR